MQINAHKSMTRSNDGVPADILSIAAPSRLVSMPKVAVASFIGAMLEWYDFFLFGTASALIFGPLFFPSTNKAIGMALAFATFGVGFVARPLGGIFFGHMGDKYGRKVTLIATMVIIGVGTFLIGLVWDAQYPRLRQGDGRTSGDHCGGEGGERHQELRRWLAL